MSASLDKSLDDIISSNKKTFKSKRPGAKFGAKGGNRVGKKIGGTNNNKKPIAKFNKPAAAVAAAVPAIDLSYATKVNVSGLPKDLKHDNIKEFFQSQIGGVQTVALSYNEKGQFKGFATIVFKSSKFATAAVDKYNGASIDGGAAKLRLELIIDTSKKPLAARIAPNAKAAAAAKTAGGKKIAAAKNALNKKKAGPGNKNNNKQKKPKQKKKTIEELDQEMADYFEN
ncbi:THO complex subunit 4 [Candida albicans P57072]|uniref:RNA-binding protein n=2 Tax=Candida albicans TaxID=5476 RepID=A0A1D8PK11_CANAL|nr:RNA-binding protein [Candida albicans SC5314]KGR10113.1 THO complex subunit 4 [Candida albicans P57072]KGR12841.1 THO complex subunit 4 [Candida albicans P78048]KGR17568.1 THO complex subunit 4 [Candida albicans P37037]KGT69889.1 THO complex subunit 4 [Candida albicans 12C]KGU10886.1 THO complex subunit 4 [Candida albicans 19F]KHC36785.1 THO complex subunit 4 [Candida albicans P76055]KHC37155.1 THO complex subunit 4 [Candida albicans P76067]KHC52288.1 THO complex subunit 4 [Candida albic|eukprot:XP_019330866.1 RNA-binding protein [Candida albicans SC5314]